jgi:uncharacterized protein (DUF924 family)
MGVDTSDSSALKNLSTDEVVGPLLSIWFLSGTKLDDIVQPFAPVIRELKSETLDPEEWNTIEGKIAKILLGDQLSRSCFRGTSEAFEYDPIARGLVYELITNEIDDVMKLPCAYLYLLPWALAHSEELTDLTSATELVDKCIGAHPQFSLFEGRNKILIAQHRAVIEVFGRYPHRNKEFGRNNTPEEQAWLDDKEALPVWVGNGAKWLPVTPDWLEKLSAMLKEGKRLPISKPKDAF